MRVDRRKAGVEEMGRWGMAILKVEPTPDR